MRTDKVNLVSKLAQFQDHWKPRTIARMNEYDDAVDHHASTDGALASLGPRRRARPLGAQTTLAESVLIRGHP